MSAAAGIMLLFMRHGASTPTGLDLGVLADGQKFTGHVSHKVARAEWNVFRKAVSGVARVIRKVFNYAPVSTAPYQLRLWKEKDGRYTYAWANVTAEQYASVEVGDEFTARGAAR